MAKAKRKDTEFEFTGGLKARDIPLRTRIWNKLWKSLYMVMSVATYLAMCLGFFIVLYFAINALIDKKYYTSIILGIVLIYSSVHINKHNPS